VTDLETHDPDLAGRLRALAREIPPADADLPALEAHAGQRRRRRRAATALGGAVVVALVAVGVLVVTGGSDDATTIATEGPSTTATSTTEATTASLHTTTVSTPTTPPQDPPPSTGEVPPGTEVAGSDEPGPYMVSHADAVVWHLPTGDVSVTPAPGVVLRAKTIGDGTAVAVTRGPVVRMFHLAPGEVLGEVPVPESLSDLWTAGLVDGRPTLVGETFGTPRRLVAVDLETGAATDVVPPDPDQGFAQPSMTADGRVLATLTMDDAVQRCRTVLIDVATGAEEPTGMDGCGFERAVAPDGETLVDISEDFTEIIRYDVASGAEIDRRPASQEVAGEGFQIEFDGRRVVLSNAYDDEYHDPFEVLDMETGRITTLPGRGPASTWIDPEPEG
jgi:hypothetical protein